MNNETFEERTETSASPPRGGRGLTGAVILIALGGALLLSNLGMLTVNWLALLRFWPVLLILAGLDIVLGRRTGILGGLVMAIIALVVIAAVVFLSGTSSVGLSGESITRQFEQPIGDVEALEVTFNLGATSAEIYALSSDEYAVQGEYTTDKDLELNIDYTGGRTGTLAISQKHEDISVPFGESGFVGELEVGLTTAVPIDLTIDTGASAITLDLTGIQLNSLTVNGGAGSLEVILPDEGDFTVEIDAGVGSIVIRVPGSLEGHISFDGALVDMNVASRFTKLGDGEWETDGYSRATDRVYIGIDAAIGSVTIIDN